MRALERYYMKNFGVTQQYVQRGHYYLSVVVLLIIVRVVLMRLSVVVMETSLAASFLSSPSASLWTIATALASPRLSVLVIPRIFVPVF